MFAIGRRPRTGPHARGRRTTRHASAVPCRLGSIRTRPVRDHVAGTGPRDPWRRARPGRRARTPGVAGPRGTRPLSPCRLGSIRTRPVRDHVAGTGPRDPWRRARPGRRARTPGVAGPRGTRPLSRAGWAPSGRARSATTWRERVLATPGAEPVRADGPARQGSQDHAARARCPRAGWAPSGRARSATTWRERVLATPGAEPVGPGPVWPRFVA